MNEKKEITMKVLVKDAKDKHIAQLSGTIPREDLVKPFTTFKPGDYPFIPPDIADDPMTLKNEILHKNTAKLPTYRMQMVDDFSFNL